MSTALAILLVISLRGDKVELPKLYLGQFYGIGWVTRHKEEVLNEKYESLGVMMTNDRLTLSITRNGRADIRIYELKSLRQWGHDNKYLAQLQQYANGVPIENGKYYLVMCVTDDIMNILISGQEYKSMTLRVNNDDFLELFTLRR